MKIGYTLFNKFDEWINEFNYNVILSHINVKLLDINKKREKVTEGMDYNRWVRRGSVFSILYFVSIYYYLILFITVFFVGLRRARVTAGFPTTW